MDQRERDDYLGPQAQMGEARYRIPEGVKCWAGGNTSQCSRLDSDVLNTRRRAWDRFFSSVVSISDRAWFRRSSHSGIW